MMLFSHWLFWLKNWRFLTSNSKWFIVSLKSGKWGCPLDNGHKLLVVQPSSSYKKIPLGTPRPDLQALHCYLGSSDLWVKIVGRHWLNLCEWYCPLDSGPKLAVEQPYRVSFESVLFSKIALPQFYSFTEVSKESASNMNSK